MAPYSPVFLSGWKPEALRADGQVWEDPVESQHKHEALRVKDEVWNNCDQPFVATISSNCHVSVLYVCLHISAAVPVHLLCSAEAAASAGPTSSCQHQQ